MYKFKYIHTCIYKYIYICVYRYIYTRVCIHAHLILESKKGPTLFSMGLFALPTTSCFIVGIETNIDITHLQFVVFVFKQQCSRAATMLIEYHGSRVYRTCASRHACM